MVDLALSAAQQMLQQSAREFLAREAPRSVVREIDASPAGFSEGLWRRIAELGWVGLPLPEDVGGAGGDLLDTAVLAEELGRAALFGPYIPTVVACLGLYDLGRADLRDRVRALATGPEVASWAVLEADARFAPTRCQTEARPHGRGYRLYGRKLYAAYGHAADLLLLQARLPDGGIGVFAVEGRPAGLSTRPMVTIGGDRLAELVLDAVEVGEEALVASRREAEAFLVRAWDLMAAIKSAEMAGGASQVLAMTVQYAETRAQFGRPLGAFQAVQHFCADMSTLADAARLTTYEAIWRLSKGLPAGKEVSIAKVMSGEAYRRVTGFATQIHGGMGAMMDYDLQLYTRGAKAGELQYGTPAEHLERIAQCLESEGQGRDWVRY